jgi:glycosyltransferase involved in cell wall biosynthesis
VESVAIIVPVKDEQDTIAMLVEQIDTVFSTSLAETAVLDEIIFVDDGSRDGTWASIRSACERFPFVRGIRFRRNFGKAAALQEGISKATADIIVTMDGDLQDDPNEIPRFLDLIRDGFDVVSGWKQVRHDPLGKTLPSRLFNIVTSIVSGVKIHDFNCGFKAYRREVFYNINLYGELHRFVPVLAHAMGFNVGEISVKHHPRRFGKSKYGVGRLIKGFLDLLTIVIITKFNSRPGHLFGGIGIAVGAIGAAMLLYLVAIWFAGSAIGNRPLLMISVLFMIVGLQFVLFGMIAELIINLRFRNSHIDNILETTSVETGHSGSRRKTA